MLARRDHHGATLLARTILMNVLLASVLISNHSSTIPNSLIQANEYISDRLCTRISAKINHSISLATQQGNNNANSSAAFITMQPNDTLAYLYLQDGAKHRFWLQCAVSHAPQQAHDQLGDHHHQIDQQVTPVAAAAAAAAVTVNTSKANQVHSKSSAGRARSSSFVHKQQHMADFESIFDWANYEELDSEDLEAISSKLPRINDERYSYLLSVSRYCESSILRHCSSFKIGLYHSTQQQMSQNGSMLATSANASTPTTISTLASSSLSKRAACPTCGSNDLNCDNVHQCTSQCGQLKSINYPANYGNNHRCRWSIRAPNGYYVNLSIVDFDIPSANNATKLGTCIFDYLTLIDGYTGKRIGCYCNENLPPANIVSPWNELIIQFDTNSETTGRGFYFQYEFMKLQLNDRLLGQMMMQPQPQPQPPHGPPTSSSSSVVAVQMAQSTSNNYVCLTGWQYFRSSCYKAYNEVEPLQWYDAENKCQAHGEGLDGHLVSILDRDEMLVILYWLTNVWNSTRYREYYIGLIDVSREGLYRWSDNNPMSYTDWELKPMLLEDETPAQPDGGAYEDCTVIRYNSFSRTSNWHDVPCSLGKHYHAHLDKGVQIKFKWDYVSSYICKSDSISTTGGAGAASSGTSSTSLTAIGSMSGVANTNNLRSRVRRPLFSNEFKPSLQSDHLIGHLSGTNNHLTGRFSQLQQQQHSSTAYYSPQHQLAVATAAAAGPASNASANLSQLSQAAVATNQTQLTMTNAPSALSPKPTNVANKFAQQNPQHYLAKLDDNRYFICDNLEVISTVLRCDGVAHCRDGSDESNGCDQDCLDWQFKCANGRCISVGHYCDFSDDCGDGSDESRCERHRCKLNEFRCQSGQCIPAAQRCDLLPDCRDSSDEGRSCTIGSNCNSASTFQCYNGLCIPQYAVCDFQIDCPGKFHEDEDATTCELLQKNQGFVRLNKTPTLTSASVGSNLSELLLTGTTTFAGNSTVPSAQVSPEEIGNSEDGHSTTTTTYGEVVFYPANRAASFDVLPDNLFRCKSGNTIDASQRCLFEFDRYGYQLGCRDVSHLVECADFECPARDYVKCPSGYCIPWRYVCDGKWDCVVGDDEVGCARYVCPGQYKCANQSSCILLHQLCDGARQCPMGDDEWFCDLQCPLGCDCIGQSVNCRWAQLTSLPSNYIPKAVRKLDLSYNRLGPNLSNSNFDAYHDLGELILSHNEIEVLTPRKFHQLRNLYKLDLSYNRIHSVKRGAFAGLRRVTQLLLESNQQLFLLEPEAFLGLSSLQMLNISSSRIQSLRKNTFDGLTSLRHLLLRSNMIFHIEDGAFRSLSSLVSLDMRGNDIKEFTKFVFSDLKSLRNLSTNSFKFCCLMNQQIPADKCLPLPDEISDCEDLLSSVPQRTCIWIAGGFACVGNLIVIIWRYRDRLGQKEREDQQVDSTLLLSLGFSDLLMGIYLIVIALVDSWYRGRYIENADKWRESPLCDFCGFLSTVSSTVSVLTLVFISYSRYLKICCPFEKCNKGFTLDKTQRLVRFCWLAALTIATLPLVIKPYFQGQFYAKSGVCLAYHITDQKAAGWLYSVLVSPCLNLVSFTIIVKCYISIYIKIARSNAERRRVARQNELATSDYQLASNLQTIKIRSRQIILIILTHFVAFSPPMILGLMSLAGYTPPAALYSWLAVSVLPVNSAINPMIYTIPHIRKTIDLLIQNYRMRKSVPAMRNSGSGGGGGAASKSPLATAARQNGVSSGANASGRAICDSITQTQNSSEQKQNFRGPVGSGSHAIELAPMLKAAGGAQGQLKRTLAKRNVPPGYVALREFMQQHARLNIGHLVDIALAIARDIEEKHREAKIYTSLRLDDVFVSECIVQAATGGNGGGVGFDQAVAAKAQEEEQKTNENGLNGVGVAPRKLAVFLSDHDGYRLKRTQPCCHQQPTGDHHHHRGHHHKSTLPNCECADVTRYGDILFKLVQMYNCRRLATERTRLHQQSQITTATRPD